MSKPAEVGDYILGQTLGEGTTGRVRLARHKESQKEVAIKIVKKFLFESKPDLERKIRREIALMRLLDHPHILKLEGICESPRHLYIILEYAKHGELFDYLIARRKLPPETAFHFFRQLIYGLEYLHAHAVCHRDLKPENILLDEFDNIKIADFGFARWMRYHIAETSCGSPHYAAPEVIRGLRYDGRAADIWSCGVILYALVAGKLPFDDPSIRNLLTKVKSGHYTMPNLPLEIQDLLSRMLTVPVDDRITMEEIKQHSAFRIGLPANYLIPTPLPLPACVDPIDPKDIDPNLREILHNIGFTSDEEIDNSFRAQGRTMPKVFHFMLLRYISLHTLPWPDDPENSIAQISENADDIYMMTPKQIAMQSPNPATRDEFFRRKQQQPQISSPGSVISSFAQPAVWSMVSGDMEDDEEDQGFVQPITDIPLKLNVLVMVIMDLIKEKGFDVLFPSDCQIISRKSDIGLYVVIQFKTQPNMLIEASIERVEGMEVDFKELIQDIHGAMEEAALKPENQITIN